MRVRRRVLGAGGSVLSLAVVVALAMTLTPGGSGVDTVVAADGDPGERTVERAEDLCPDGAERSVKLDFAWLSEPPTDPDTALREWVDRAKSAGSAGDYERARIASKDTDRRAYAFARSNQDGRVRTVVEVSPITDGEYFTPTTVLECE